jgi:GNAT superfamily N-acetyltransferase
MSLIVQEEPMSSLAEHAKVPIAFLVERVLDVSVTDRGLGGIALREVPVAIPWEKNYDLIDGEGPPRWAERFDTANWCLIAAHDGGRRLGGAVIAFDAPGVMLLEGRRDLAVLWDLRIRPEVRRSGIGTTVFRSTEAWARRRGCRTLKVETQTSNLPACRFYARMGCELIALDRNAYPGLPDETQLLWSKQL